MVYKNEDLFEKLKRTFMTKKQKVITCVNYSQCKPFLACILQIVLSGIVAKNVDNWQNIKDYLCAITTLQGIHSFACFPPNVVDWPDLFENLPERFWLTNQRGGQSCHDYFCTVFSYSVIPKQQGLHALACIPLNAVD